MNDARKVLVVAVFLASVVSGRAVEAQSLDTTSTFITQNINDIHGADCSSISGHTYTVQNNGAQGPETTFSFKITEVVPSVEIGGDSGGAININCISGACIHYSLLESSSNETFETRVDPGRVVKALLHLQDICGGKTTSPF